MPDHLAGSREQKGLKGALFYFKYEVLDFQIPVITVCFDRQLERLVRIKTFEPDDTLFGCAVKHLVDVEILSIIVILMLELLAVLYSLGAVCVY